MPQGKDAGISGYFSDTRFSNSLSMHHLASYRSLFIFLYEAFTLLVTPKGKKKINKALSK